MEGVEYVPAWMEEDDELGGQEAGGEKKRRKTGKERARKGQEGQQK